jgi:hypothetical protein
MKSGPCRYFGFRTARAVALLAGLTLSQNTPPALAQTSPATFPDLKLSTAGRVNAIAVQDDGKIIIGGTFVSVNDTPRPNLARLNPNGSLDLTWNPQISGQVLAVAIDGTNIYLGGNFGSIDLPGRYGLVRVSALDGATDRDWGPNGWGISAIVVDGTDLYVAGSFSYIGAFARNNIAKLSTVGTGLVDPIWDPSADGLVQSLVVGGNEVFVAGYFSSIGGQSRQRLAKLSASGAGAADSLWEVPIVEQYTNEIWSLALSGTNLYVSGSFTKIGGVMQASLAKLSTLGSGAVDRNWSPPPPVFYPPIYWALAVTNNTLFASFNAQVGSNSAILKFDANGAGTRDTNWNATFDFAPSNLRATPSALFAGGSFGLCNGAVSLSVAKVDLLAGARDITFQAQAQSPGWVAALAEQSDGKIIVGGNFWFAGGLPRQHLARINRDGTLDVTWAPEVNGRVSALAVSETNLFVGGLFTRAGGLPRDNLAKIALLGSDATDPAWDVKVGSPGSGAYLNALAVIGQNLFVSGYFDSISGQGRYNLAKVSTEGVGKPDASWKPTPIGSPGTVGFPECLAVLGTNLYVGGDFIKIDNIRRRGVAKLFPSGSNPVDRNWDASIVETIEGDSVVKSLVGGGTNLFVAGYFTNVGGLTRYGLAKVSALGTGAVDGGWNTGANFPGDPYPWVPMPLSLNEDATSLYVGMSYRLGKVDAASGVRDPLFDPFVNAGVFAVLARQGGLYVGGNFSQIGDQSRFGFAFLPVAGAPQMVQDTATNFFIFPNANSGAEVTHFRITYVSGGTLLPSGSLTPVNVGDFLTLAEGSAGLNFVPGGTVTAVSALNNTTKGAGTAATTLTMSTNPRPVFRFSAAAYSVREGAGSIVIPARKFGNGAATVNYATSDLTAKGGLNYQSASGTLSFSALDKTKNLIIGIGDDFQVEGDVQFAITLTNASTNASIAGPATAVVTISDNDLLGIASSLTAIVAPTNPPVSTGTLTVWLQPTNANGQWRLLGELNWHNSGDTISGLVTGNYSIEFRPVSGYFQPGTQAIPISAGTNNWFTNSYFTNIFSAQAGNLSVTIGPSDVANATSLTLRGQWHKQGDSPANWFNSGDIVSNLPPGSYTVQFKEVSGRLTPPPQTVQVGPNATYSVGATYLFASAPGAEMPTVVDFGQATTNAPFFYNGQIQSSVGFGSGFVVKPRVVLTAAHVLFDDYSLQYTTLARWFFQRYRDQLEPVPQVPRGWYLFEGYASQRQLDNSPGLSTPDSQNLDAAAVYFLEDAGRGGYGGYLTSDADANEYLLSANNKFLVGYPLGGVTNEADKGKLFSTPAQPENLTFTRLYTTIFATTNIASFPGNSGGPLYVQADVNKYLPAAIYLGGSGQTLVRAINSEVVDLIKRAEIASNGGGNSTGGGVAIISPGITAPAASVGLLTVSLSPSNAANVRPGWRIRNFNDTNFITAPLTTNEFTEGGSLAIEFKPVPAFDEPSNVTVQIVLGQEVIVQAIYVPCSPSLGFSFGNGLSLNCAVGATYRVEYTTNLGPAANWTPLTTQTLSSSSVTIPNTRPANSGRRFYRAVLMP